MNAGQGRERHRAAYTPEKNLENSRQIEAENRAPGKEEKEKKKWGEGGKGQTNVTKIPGKNAVVGTSKKHLLEEKAKPWKEGESK